MSSAFVAILAALITALTEATSLAGGRVYPNHLNPIALESNTAIVVRLDQATAPDDTIGSQDWTTSYTVECYARAATGTDSAIAVDALLSDAWARLSTLAPAGLGVAAVTLQNTIDWQYDDAATPVVCALIRLQVQHRTSPTNLAPWA